MSEHTTHFDDCGCQSAALLARAEAAEALNVRLREAMENEFPADVGTGYRAHTPKAISAVLALTPATALAERDARVRAEEREACIGRAVASSPCWGDKRTGPEACGEGGDPLVVCELHANMAAAIRARTPAAGSGEKEA